MERSESLILCGNFNCPGDNGQSVSDGLDEVQVSSGLKQHVRQPTRGANLLDIVASSDPKLVRDVFVVDCGRASDHNLVTVHVAS